MSEEAADDEWHSWVSQMPFWPPGFGHWPLERKSMTFLSKGQIVNIFGILHTKNWKLSVLIIGNRSPYFHIQSFICPDCSRWWNCPSQPRSELRFFKCFLQTGSGSCPEVSLECKEEDSILDYSQGLLSFEGQYHQTISYCLGEKKQGFLSPGVSQISSHTSDFLFTLLASQMSYFGGLGLEQSLKKICFLVFVLRVWGKKKPQNNTKTNQR